MRVCLLSTLLLMTAAAGARQPLFPAAWDEPVLCMFAPDVERACFQLDLGYELVRLDSGRLVFRSQRLGEWSLDGLECEPDEITVLGAWNDGVALKLERDDGLAARIDFCAYSANLTLCQLTLERAHGPVEVAPAIRFIDGLRVEPRIGAATEGVGFDYVRQPAGWQEAKLAKYLTNFSAALALYDDTGLVQSPWSYREPRDATPPRLSPNISGPYVAKSVGRRVLSTTLTLEAPARLRWVWARDARPTSERYLSELIQWGAGLDLAAWSAGAEARFFSVPKTGDRRADLTARACATLMRGCLLPPEGLAPVNYYVFSREPTWTWGGAGQVMHESIGTIAHSRTDPERAMDSLRLYRARQHPDGYIPYRLGGYLEETIITRGERTSSGPLLAWITWEVYRRTADRAFLAEMYPACAANYRWWVRNRDADGDGLCEWNGFEVLECLRDSHNVIFQDVLPEREIPPRELEALDLNCMLVSEADHLAEMAHELHRSEAREWKDAANARRERINACMWDEATGFYYHCYRDDHRIGEELKRREFIGLLPLWARVAPKERARRLIAAIEDPNQFGRAYGIPSLSAADVFYTHETGACRWNGPVWPQWTYMMWCGLRNYGEKELAGTVAKRQLEAVEHYLGATHRLWEQYDPDHLQPLGANANYYWTGIVLEMLDQFDK